MTFELLTPTAATLSSVTPRTEVHGEDRVMAISLGLKLVGPNTLLDALSSTLRHALYMAVPGQDQLPGVEPTTPLLRTRFFEEVKIGPSQFEGWTLAIDHGIDEADPITIGGCKVDKFRCVPKEGGSIELMFRVGSNDIDAKEAGLLCSHLSQEITFTLKAPERQADAIDGSQAAFAVDHPDAGDLFSDAHGGNFGGPEDESDSEGGDLDVETGGDDEGAPLDLEDRLSAALDPAEPDREGDWPFPEKSNNSMEAPPHAVSVETSRPGTRTARGRDRTKAALSAGAGGAR